MRIVSGIQPTGEMHLGNYLGAFRQFVELQKSYEVFFMVADLHAMTEIHDKKRLKDTIADTKKAFLAFGLDPTRSTLFLQSDIPQHTELAWMLATIMPKSELERMTQFKEKRQQGEETNMGLFTYPLLMAADVLLYRAQGVPVGEDQVQHLELARTLARRFNTIYGSTFYEPKPLLSQKSARVMSLQDPRRKMSKSLGSKHYVGIFENERSIREKFQRAVTDSDSHIKYNLDEKPGISNLLNIYTAITGVAIDAAQKHFRDKTYAEFKHEIADIVIEEIKPIQKRYRALKAKDVDKAFENGQKKAEKEATANMEKIKKQVGLL